jgi:hypothetical protein
LALLTLSAQSCTVPWVHVRAATLEVVDLTSHALTRAADHLCPIRGQQPERWPVRTVRLEPHARLKEPVFKEPPPTGFPRAGGDGREANCFLRNVVAKSTGN